MASAPAHTQFDCIVTGAGFAGIAAAMHLSQAGQRVLLLESRAYVGGRVRSFREAHTGEDIDNGQHLLMGAYRHTLPLLESLGTSHLLRPQERLRVVFVEADGRGNVLDSRGWPGAAGMARALVGLGGISAAEKLQALSFAARLRLGVNFEGFTTIHALLKAQGQSDRLITRFWEPMVLATMNAAVEEAAAEPFLNVLRRAFLGSSQDMLLFFPAAGLSELLAPLEGFLSARGSQLTTGASVDQLLIEEGAARGVELKSGERLYARTVISAVPARALGRLLPPQHGMFPAELHQAIASARYSPIVSVYLWFDRDFLEHDFVAMLGTKIQWVFNRRRLCPADQEIRHRFPGHLTLTVSAADAFSEQSADDIAAHCVAELRAAFSGAAAAHLLHAKVIKEKMATFRLSAEYDALRPAAATALKGFYLAGDWTSTALPATIEGAAQSGVEAASLALKALERR